MTTAPAQLEVGGPARHERRGRRIVEALGVVIIVLQGLPFPPVFPWASLDLGWNLAIHSFFRTGAQWGVDVVFPAGPLGFLLTPLYHSNTFGAAMAISFAIALVVGLSCVSLARQWGLTTTQLGLWLVALTVMLAGEGLFMAAPALLLADGLDPEDHGRVARARSAALAAACAAVGLVKFNYLVTTAALVGVVSIDRALHRRWPWQALVYLVTLSAVWLGSGQAVSSAGPYLRWSMELARGYEEMSAGQSSREFAPLLAAFLLASAGVLVAVVFGVLRERRWRGVPLIAGFLGLMFVWFKHGFVRADNTHVGYAFTGIWLIGLVGLPWVARRGGLGRGLAVAGLATLGLGVLPPRPVGAPWARVYSSLAMVSRGPSGELRESTRRFEDATQREIPIPPVTGTTDCYTARNLAVLAHGLPYRNRPVLQSYSAYTPALSELNAAFLRSEHAPDNLLLSLDPIDERFPLQEDAASWPEVFARYEPVRHTTPSPFLWVRRRAAPRKWSLTLLAKQSAAPGELVAAPSATGGPVWVTINALETPTRRAKALVFVATPVRITTRAADGTTDSHRCIVAAARGGFVLSPYVAETADLLAMYNADNAYARLVARSNVVSLTLDAPPDEVRGFEIVFHRLTIE